ncbi:MAG: SMP-30/gluconolactonase/LRE family protein [Bacteroidia bacterium]|nr:SMP-30/gluconolactonase/LRE family protein [Bacteroidia bacterium]
MKKSHVILLLLIALLLFFIANTLHQAGVFREIHPHIEGEAIRTYDNIPGPEDIDIDRTNGLLFISSTDRRDRGQNPSDGIYLLDLSTADIPILLQHDFSGEFHPHGISVVHQDSSTFLFVVNHNAEGDFIESFEYREDQLHHIRSYKDEIDMCCPNDVVGISKETFYVTNDHGNRSGFGRTMEEYLRLAKSNFIYYNGTSFREAYSGLKMANGIQLSNDGTRLYVTHTLGQELLTFERNKTDETLRLMSRTPLHSGVDNIDVDESGNLWIGSHPKLFDFVSHAGDPTALSPSQVFKLSPLKDDDEFVVEEVLLDDGTIISGSSVAVRYGNELYVGCVFESKIVRIQLN